jgi:Tfp pilus assembly protein PilZ
MEKRVSRRVGITDETSMFTKDGYFTAVLTNISMGGLYLRTNKRLELGAMIEITIPLPNNPEKSKIVVNVIAVRIMDDGAAFKFKNLDDDTYSALFHLISSSHA